MFFLGTLVLARVCLLMDLRNPKLYLLAMSIHIIEAISIFRIMLTWSPLSFIEYPLGNIFFHFFIFSSLIFLFNLFN